MHNKIKATQAELGLSLSKLSQLIGHHSNYLSRALRDGVSTANQAEIIKKLDDLKSNVNADKEQYVLARYHDQELYSARAIIADQEHQLNIAENEFTALEASYKNALERERNLSDKYDHALKEMAAAKHKEAYWWVALVLVAFVVVALALL